MKYAFGTVDVFSASAFGGNQLASLPDAAGISTEGMSRGVVTSVSVGGAPANIASGEIEVPPSGFVS